jgi:tryptophanyl-tRNA synthetase
MFFLEDDAKLEEVRAKYSKGEMLTGEVKELLISCLQKFVAEFQERRKKVTNETVKQFMAVRKINPFPKHWEAGKKL